MYNKESNTGVLLWMSSYCISCVFQCHARQKMSYHVFVYNSCKATNVLKTFSDVDSVIDLFCSIIQSKFNCFETKYEVAFLRCLSELSNIERKKMIRKHRSTSEIATTGRKRRETYSSMDPGKKKNFFQVVLKSTGLWTHPKNKNFFQIKLKSISL